MLGLIGPAVALAAAPIGPVITVDPIGYEPGVATDDDGDFIVVWKSDYGYVAGRLFEGDGTPLSPSFSVSEPGVSLYGYIDQGPVGVASDGTDFVVAWSGYEDTPTTCTSFECIFSRHVDSTGTLGNQLVVEDSGPAEQSKHPRISGNGVGTFVTVWEGLDGDGEGVQGRTLASDGSGASAQFQANETEAQYQCDVGWCDVAGGPTGEFIVAWTSDFQGIGLRRFDAGGTALASESFATGWTGVYPIDPQVAYAANGNFLVVWESRSGSDKIQGRAFDSTSTPLGPVFDIADAGDPYQPAVAGYPADDFVVVWRGDDGVRGQRFDSAGAAIGPEFSATDYGIHPGVDTDANGNFTVVWTAYDAVYAQRFAPLLPIPLTGKKIKLEDKVPDDPLKRKARWVVKDAAIALPDPLSDGDPRCNADPVGTVKASVRFFSSDSGHDTGEIPLPCELWFGFGAGTTLAYQYQDKKLLEGPCKFIKLKHGKQIKATCLGKNPLHPLEYDLEIGTDERTVHTVLTLGDRKFCSSIPTFKTKDGSDGKLFLGKDGPAPAHCL